MVLLHKIKKTTTLILLTLLLCTLTNAVTKTDYFGNTPSSTGTGTGETNGYRISINSTYNLTNITLNKHPSSSVGPANIYYYPNQSLYASVSFSGNNGTFPSNVTLIKGQQYYVVGLSNGAIQYNCTSVSYPMTKTLVQVENGLSGNFGEDAGGKCLRDIISITASEVITASGFTANLSYVSPTFSGGDALNNLTLNINTTTNGAGNTSFKHYLYNSTGGLILQNNYTGTSTYYNSTFNLTNLPSGVYYFNASVTINATYNATSTTRNVTFDATNPYIVIGANNEFDRGKLTTIDRNDDQMTINMTFTDDLLLYSYIINISNSGTLIYNYTNTSLTGTSYNLNTNLNVSAWERGIYDINIRVTDAHTQHQIPDYQIDSVKSKITFKTQTDNNIKIETRENSDITANKTTDRYTFTMNFSDGQSKARTFDIKTDLCPLTYLAHSQYKAHFISTCPNIIGGNWIDFEGINTTPIIFKYDDYHYSVFFDNVPSIITFNSVGSLNTYNYTFQWYKGPDILTGTGGGYKNDRPKENNVLFNFNDLTDWLSSWLLKPITTPTIIAPLVIEGTILEYIFIADGAIITGIYLWIIILLAILILKTTNII